VRAARDADVVIVAVGETADMSGEAASRTSLDLPGRQLELLQAIHQTGKPYAVVLMNGRPLSINWVAENSPAVLETWFAGTRGGEAIADALFGDYNPGGKLTVTFPRVTGQVPIYYNHKNTGRPPADSNKYSSKYLDVSWTPLYPFGHGLSYATFSLGAPRPSAAVLRPGDSLDVAVDVTNTGSVAGDEVVQLYVRDDVASVTRPVQELRGFRRVRLAPRESRTVHFTIGEQALAFYDASMTRVVEPGTFTVLTGDDAAHTSPARFRFETHDGKPVPLPERCEGRRAPR
jgi:beta-glucosidase